MKSLVLCFSRVGSTKIVADIIAEKLKTEVAELAQEKPCRVFVRSGYMATTGKRPSLASDPWALCRDRELIVHGAPIWAGNGNPVINNFLDQADLSGTKVALFTVQADPRLKSSGKVLDIPGGNCS